MTYAAAYRYLIHLPRFADLGDLAYRPGLDTMHQLMTAMGQPHRAYPCIHVAGTNGKGSTASMLAAIASASGARTGLHTSPHLFRFTERMRLNGLPAPEAWVADAVGRFQPTFETLKPSFFEASTALAFLYFAEHHVDLALVEVGMGGRLDATNVVSPQLSVITHIGLDHTAQLGNTLEAIAREKAGIIKPGVQVVSAVQPAAVQAVLAAVAEAQAAPFHDALAETRLYQHRATPDGLILDLETPVRRYTDLRVALAGPHQSTNARLAVRAAELGLPGVTEAAVRQGLAEIAARSGLRGRCDLLQRRPVIVADAAHNADGLRTALAFMRSLPKPTERLYVLFGTLQDKAVQEMVQMLAEAKATVLPVGLSGPRGLAVAALVEHLEAQGVPWIEVPDVAGGLNWFQVHARTADLLLVTGSHRILGDLPEGLFR